VPLLNRKITHEVCVTPYPIKNAVEVVLPDAVLAFRKCTPFKPLEEQSAKSVTSTKSDDLIIVSDMMSQLNINSDEFASPDHPPVPSDSHLKGAVAWRLLEILRDKTDARQNSFRGVLYAFRSTNIIMWRYNEEGTEWQQFGDGELTIYHANNKWIIKWARRYDQKVMLHAILERYNTEYTLGGVPLSRGVLFSVIKASQDGQRWNVMFQCRGAKSVEQLYAESLQDLDSDDEEMRHDDYEKSEEDEDPDAMSATSTNDFDGDEDAQSRGSMSGDNEPLRSLEDSIEMPLDEYRRMVHWAFLKALARTPARPARLGARRTAHPESSSSSLPHVPTPNTDDSSMDTS
jgi:hypothetical protein